MDLQLADELLEAICANTPTFFEILVVEKSAFDYAKSVPNANIILVDGLTLAKLMIKHDLGVGTNNIIRIKKIDTDYFEEQ